MTASSLTGTGVLTALAFVLALAGSSKLRTRNAGAPAGEPLELRGRLMTRTVVPIGELVLAGIAVIVPTRISAPALLFVFAAFATVHLRLWRAGAEDCDCFGDVRENRGHESVRFALSAISAAVMIGVAIAAPLPLASVWSREPATGLALSAGALVAALTWRRAFIGARLPGRSSLGERVVNASAVFLERRVSRRTLLVRVAVTGSALAVAPLRYLLYPISALAALDPGSCGGGLCTDGYTVFCCEIHSGQNTCPAGTYPGGWWMCTSYQGSELCAPQGVRYYVDCNQLPGSDAYGCTCGNGSCANRREACNIFRYGQCNTQIGGVTAVVCRMVVCENPGSIPHLNCSSSVAVDDGVCDQDVPCLQAPAIELKGAGGV
jgi:hypothetical protein